MIWLIGISGKIQAGKDTLGTILVDSLHDLYGQFFEIRKFAYVLRQEVADMLGIDFFDTCREPFKTQYFPSFHLTGGEMLQTIGHVSRREDPDYWVKQLAKDFTPESKWIITDVRYPNEAEWIYNQGGIVLRIHRNQRKTNGRQAHHESETALDNYDAFHCVIKNDGRLPQLALCGHVLAMSMACTEGGHPDRRKCRMFQMGV